MYCFNMLYYTDQWVTKRWETDDRYYVAEVCQDLFGCWLVKRRWGGQKTLRGSGLAVHAEDYAHALAMLDDVAKRRRARGYHDV